MPTFIKGDMWSVFGKTDLFLVTTNPAIRKDGACVMGAGIAKQAKERFPRLPYDLGDNIRLMVQDDQRVNAGFIGKYDGQLVGYFMVKNHWAQPAKLGIIQRSVRDLNDEIFMMKPDRVDLNFPGIGNGKLSREEVLPLLESLPSYVHIWEYE